MGKRQLGAGGWGTLDVFAVEVGAGLARIDAGVRSPVLARGASEGERRNFGGRANGGIRDRAAA